MTDLRARFGWRLWRSPWTFRVVRQPADPNPFPKFHLFRRTRR